jgi:hypothetical protein
MSFVKTHRDATPRMNLNVNYRLLAGTTITNVPLVCVFGGGRECVDHGGDL